MFAFSFSRCFGQTIRQMWSKRQPLMADMRRQLCLWLMVSSYNLWHLLLELWIIFAASFMKCVHFFNRQLHWTKKFVMSVYTPPRCNVPNSHLTAIRFRACYLDLENSLILGRSGYMYTKPSLWDSIMTSCSPVQNLAVWAMSIIHVWQVR